MSLNLIMLANSRDSKNIVENESLSLYSSKTTLVTKICISLCTPENQNQEHVYAYIYGDGGTEIN